jgi:hypothetical protein
LLSLNPYATRLNTSSINSPSVRHPNYICFLTYQSTTHNHRQTHSVVKHLLSEPLIPSSTISYSPIYFLAFSPSNYSLPRFFIYTLSPVGTTNYARTHGLISSPSLDQIIHLRSLSGERGSVVVKALCYKPEGRGLDTRCGDFLNLPNPSGRARPWGLLSL